MRFCKSLIRSQTLLLLSVLHVQSLVGFSIRFQLLLLCHISPRSYFLFPIPLAVMSAWSAFPVVCTFLPPSCCNRSNSCRPSLAALLGGDNECCLCVEIRQDHCTSWVFFDILIILWVGRCRPHVNLSNHIISVNLFIKDVL